MNVAKILIRKVTSLNKLLHSAEAPKNFKQKVSFLWKEVSDLYVDYNYLFLDENAPKAGDWVVVIDDSNNTMKLGEGNLYQVLGQSRHYSNCWNLKNITSPYPKSIFRLATKQEIKD